MLLVRIAVNALALLAAGLLLPGISIAWGDDRDGALLTLAVLAAVFGIINAFVKPFARLLAVPLNVLTLGLFSMLLNGALLLLLAGAIDVVWDPILTVGGFPPDLSLEAFAAAAAGAAIISLVSGVMSVLIPDA